MCSLRTFIFRLRKFSNGVLENQGELRDPQYTFLELRSRYESIVHIRGFHQVAPSYVAKIQKKDSRSRNNIWITSMVPETCATDPWSTNAPGWCRRMQIIKNAHFELQMCISEFGRSRGALFLSTKNSYQSDPNMISRSRSTLKSSEMIILCNT